MTYGSYVAGCRIRKAADFLDLGLGRWGDSALKGDSKGDRTAQDAAQEPQNGRKKAEQQAHG